MPAVRASESSRVFRRSKILMSAPAMNVVPATLVGGPGTSGQLVGFRPEHIEPGTGGDGASFEADVEVVEYLGDEQLVHLRLGDVTVLAKLDVDQRLRQGDRSAFRVRADRLHRFDAETEEAIV